MNSAKVERAIAPFLIAAFFTFISCWSSNAFPSRTVTNILALGGVELYFFYLVVAFDMNHSKKRIMCTILTISIAFLTTPYAIATWLYTNTNVAVIDKLHDVIYNSYEPFSIAIFTLLITVSILSRKLTDAICSNFGVDRAISIIGNRFKVRFFETKGGPR